MEKPVNQSLEKIVLSKGMQISVMVGTACHRHDSVFGLIDGINKSRMSLKWRSLSWERMSDFVHFIFEKSCSHS